MHACEGVESSSSVVVLVFWWLCGKSRGRSHDRVTAGDRRQLCKRLQATAGECRRPQASTGKYQRRFVAPISCVVVEEWVNVVVVVHICVTAGEGTSDVLCQHFDGGRPQASVGEHMQVSVLVDVMSLCWGRLTLLPT